jgi:chromosome segregation ATPase
MILSLALILITLILLFVLLKLKNVNNALIILKNLDKTDAIENIKRFILMAHFFIYLLAEFKKKEAELQPLVIKNESLKQKNQNLEQEKESIKQNVQKLDEKILSLEWELNEAVKLTTKIRAKNTILEQKNKELEANRKALIEELGGAVGREDLEYATWDLVLQTTKLLIKERDKAVQENQSLKQENRQLSQSINSLESQINSKENEINFVKQNLRDAEREVSALQARYSSSLKHIQNESHIQVLQEENYDNQNIMTDLKENIYQELKLQEKTEVNSKNRYKNNQILSVNEERELKLEGRKISDCDSTELDIELMNSNNYFRAIDEYNKLIDFIQIDFPDSGVEEINEWRKSENFYFHIIRQLYMINLLVVYKVRELEELIINDSYNYTGKTLYWRNQELLAELNTLLCEARFSSGC